MRISSALFSAAAISVGAALLSACSGGSQSTPLGLPATGVANHSIAATGPARPVAGHVRVPAGAHLLFVADRSNDVHVFWFRGWKTLGTISDGINSPVDDWVDTKGNLYVANTSSALGVSVTEYDRSLNLIYTYSGIQATEDVTTDKLGNVYVVDIYAKKVIEYPQASNNSFSCSVPSGPVGIAVDKAGDVFVTTPFGASQILEFQGGLFESGCNSQLLPVSISEPFGIAVDKQGNLIVANNYPPAVDIVAPPYTSITGTLGSGYVAPTSVTLDKKGTQAYVGDVFGGVYVVRYPGGSLVTTLGSANGLSRPDGAVSSSNYAP